MLVEAIGTPRPSPEQTLPFDGEQKEVCAGRGESWVAGDPHNGALFPAGPVFYNRGGAGVNGLMMETIPLIQAYRRIFCSTRSPE